jgi:hypothetical protein
MPSVSPRSVNRVSTVVLAQSPLLSWVTAGPYSLSGVSGGSGKTVVLLGLIGFALTMGEQTSRRRIAGLVASVTALVCCLSDLLAVRNIDSELGGGRFGFTPGAGLIIATVASVGWLTANTWRIRAPFRTDQSVRTGMTAGRATR